MTIKVDGLPGEALPEAGEMESQLPSPAMLNVAAAGSECDRVSVSHPEGILKT